MVVDETANYLITNSRHSVATATVETRGLISVPRSGEVDAEWKVGDLGDLPDLEPSGR